jgi:hypothetical protein
LSIENWKLKIVALGGLAIGLGWAGAAELVHSPQSDPVALRMESFTVPPSSRPLAFVVVKNLQAAPYEGSLRIKAPAGWRLAPSDRQLALRPGETKRVPFTVERGSSVRSNSYPMEISATGAGVTVVRRQDVVCASAPYFSPTIDGDPGEWKDAIPVTFTVGGRKTVISTYWNRRQFSILVAVEEQSLIAYRPGSTPEPFDAVQVALSAQDTQTGESPDGEATRFEFLLVSTGSGTTGKCFQLASPGMKLAEAAKDRSLEPLLYEKAPVAVSRTGNVTYYECGVPFSLMSGQIRLGEGREFCLSVLVHDPDGTGIRDWGQAAGLWPTERNPLAWSRFPGAKWGKNPPLDNKLPWGMCSSLY